MVLHYSVYLVSNSLYCPVRVCHSATSNSTLVGIGLYCPNLDSIWYNSLAMNDLLERLNPQQQLAVAAPPGPTVVLAGPGSGKTRVLTYRIAYLISVLNVPAYNILAVTFTNKAAKQMGERVTKLIGPHAEGIWLGTFHAICGRILRREADLLPVNKNFVIFDTDDQEALMKQILRDNNLDEKLYKPASILA